MSACYAFTMSRINWKILHPRDWKKIPLREAILHPNSPVYFSERTNHNSVLCAPGPTTLKNMREPYGEFRHWQIFIKENESIYTMRCQSYCTMTYSEQQLDIFWKQPGLLWSMEFNFKQDNYYFDFPMKRNFTKFLFLFLYKVYLNVSK